MIIKKPIVRAPQVKKVEPKIEKKVEPKTKAKPVVVEPEIISIVEDEE